MIQTRILHDTRFIICNCHFNQFFFRSIKRLYKKYQEICSRIEGLDKYKLAQGIENQPRIGEEEPGQSHLDSSCNELAITSGSQFDTQKEIELFLLELENLKYSMLKQIQMKSTYLREIEELKIEQAEKGKNLDAYDSFGVIRAQMDSPT